MTAASVGIVTTVGCPYCKKAKEALSKEHVEYINADLTGDPLEALTKVKAFTGQRTVPQVFIGGDFVGGASELLEIIDKQHLQEKLEAMSGRPAFPKALDGVIQNAIEAQKEANASKATAMDEETEKLRQDLEHTLIRKTRVVGCDQYHYSLILPGNVAGKSPTTDVEHDN